MISDFVAAKRKRVRTSVAVEADKKRREALADCAGLMEYTVCTTSVLMPMVLLLFALYCIQVCLLQLNAVANR
jgi:hypothetical protein